MAKAKHWALVQVKMPPDSIKVLQSLSKAWGSSIAETVRRAIKQAWDPFPGVEPIKTRGGASVIDEQAAQYGVVATKKRRPRAARAK